MICPFCKRNTSRMFKEEGVYCSNCGKLLESFLKPSQPTLKCPKCGEYSNKEYCSNCGYNFKAGVDY